MTDARLLFNNITGDADLTMLGGDLLGGNELETAVLISIFSDAQADPGDVTNDTDPRGWWADTYAAFEDTALPTLTTYRTGSKLWQVFARPRNQQTLNWMRDQILIALNWMLTDGVASAIHVVPVFTTSGGVGATISITANGVPTQYNYAWAQET